MGDLDLSALATEMDPAQASLTAMLENRTASDIHVEVSLLGDDGSASGTHYVLLGAFDMAPSTTVQIPVSLATLGFDIPNQTHSGQIHIAVDARRLGDHPQGPKHQRALSPGLFFHPADPDSSQVLIYGKAILDSQFARGDFAESDAPAGDTDAVYDRVIHGGRGEERPTPVLPGDEASDETGSYP
ncbi:MAG: hypothetical protein U0168_01840 [Nannocystaceae bacterium]